MAFTILVPSITGVLNGYIKKEGGLPTFEKMTIMGFSTTFGFMRGLSKLHTMNLQMHITPGQGLAVLFLGIPFFVGSSYCTGHHFGKALRHIEDIRSLIRG
jgi:hypothetical protein